MLVVGGDTLVIHGKMLVSNKPESINIKNAFLSGIAGRLNGKGPFCQSAEGFLFIWLSRSILAAYEKL
jgi:hypothetical protein